MALQVVFEYSSRTDIVLMQRLNKRFYNVFCPALIREFKLYEMGNMTCGLMVFPGNEDCIFKLNDQEWLKKTVVPVNMNMRSVDDELYDH